MTTEAENGGAAARWGGWVFRSVHRALTVLGVVCVLGLVTLMIQPELLKVAEDTLYRTLRRQAASGALPTQSADRATATELESLDPRQARVSEWLARKYRVAPEPIAALVLEAHRLARGSKLSAHLILAVAAVESNFHPYVQSAAGAQGLMQVMPGVHRKRYEEHGGSLAAFDAVVSMRVGVGILEDFVRLRGGSIDEGLKAYLGGAGLQDDGGYVAKVRSEESRLDRVAAGQDVPVQ